MRPHLRHRAHIGALIASFLIAVCGRPAAAQDGLNLSWDDCGAAGTGNKVFSCDTNDAQFTIVASIRSNSAVNTVTSIAFNLDFQFDQTTPPSWWPILTPADCRIGALGASVLFPASMTACAKSSFPGFPAVITTPITHPDPFTTRVPVEVQADPGFSGSFPAGAEVYLCRVTVTAIRTVGPGACGGCGTGACITLSRVQLTTFPGSVRTFLIPLHSNTVAWQSGSGFCSTPTSAQRPTWGAIKQLYR